MTSPVVVAGATGKLGSRIVRALKQRGATVHAVVRESTARDKLAAFERFGVQCTPVDMGDAAALARALEGASCVVSALLGLRDVLVDLQTTLVDASIAAGVPRFIPSDYSIDFAKTVPGNNRNLDWHRELHEQLAGKSIAWTSVLSGAFMEMLVARMPLLDLGSNRVMYWEDPDQLLDFTTMDDAATFTAAAALDASTPRYLRVAGDSISANGLVALAGDVTKTPFELVRAGSLEELAAVIQRERTASPASEHESFPRWQGAQYMLDMFGGKAKLEPLDNDRYPGMKWTTVRELLARHLGLA